MRFKETGRPIKVLSLFFIDSVEHYRQYDEHGNSVKGKYALMFEEEYAKLAKANDYHTLFASIDVSQSVEDLHNGYFYYAVFAHIYACGFEVKKSKRFFQVQLHVW